MHGSSILVIHANWTAGQLHLWAESLDQFNKLPSGLFDVSKTSTTSNGQTFPVEKETHNTA